MNTNVADIRIEDYDYPLPDERIAKHPLQERDRCKLLVRKPGGALYTRVFNELPALLPAQSLLIYNNTRVINARLRFRKPGGGAVIEIFCLEPVDPADYAVSFASSGSCSWLCFVGNSKRWKSGSLTMPLDIDGTAVTLNATREAREGNASVINFSWDNSDVTFSQIISAAGEIPIPPYLNRDTEPSDSTDYQTVFSHIDGSVAAPTAGLHFTDEVLHGIDAAGMERRELTLHVGAGTFQPVKSDSIGEHDMHSEFIAVSRDLIRELADTTRPVIAVGTTSVRTLESLYHIGCLVATGQWTGEVPQWYPYSDNHPRLSRRDSLSALVKWLDSTGAKTLLASTRIIIAPGYDFKVVNGIITNFHQPKSTLLLLVSAFIGGGWREMYDYALTGDYRFLSYGDASLLLR